LEVAYTLSGVGLLLGGNHDQDAGGRIFSLVKLPRKSRVEFPLYDVVGILMCLCSRIQIGMTAFACFSSSSRFLGMDKVIKELLRAHATRPAKV
jgi:hypothetical protein